MRRRFLVLVMRNPAFDASAAPAHNAFLDALHAEGCLELAGPFTDRSGGAYLLRAESLAEATGIAHRDPLHVQGLSTVTIHEWSAT